MAEQWKQIPGHWQYEASDLGNIRSVDRWVRFGKTDRLRFAKGQTIKQTINNVAYRQVTLGRKTNNPVHRLIALTFIGPCPTGLEVRHRDGNKLNNKLENLRYGTRAENQADRVRHGTSNRGRCLVICERCGAKRRPDAKNPPCR